MSLMFDTLTTSALFVLVALGLWFIFGLLDVINLAMAGFMAIGVYSVVALGNLWVGLGVAILLSGGLGFLVEWLVIRRLYRRPLDAIVATWGISIILVQVISLVFTPVTQNLDNPLAGTYWFEYPAYRISLALAAVFLLAAAGLVLRFTRAGLVVRIVMQNEPLASGIGVNTAKVRTLTFVTGSVLLGAVGAVIGPLQTVTPNYGEAFLIIAILAVLMSGRTIWGLIIACLLVGITSTLFNAYAPVPVYGTVAVVVVGVLALRFFPGGFAWKRRAK